ncbi:MAG: hypothetical protein POG74_09580 [Acidocella sp.]|nr:hypothetical protein [Acidocella sp.]
MTILFGCVLWLARRLVTGLSQVRRVLAALAAVNLCFNSALIMLEAGQLWEFRYE